MMKQKERGMKNLAWPETERVEYDWDTESTEGEAVNFKETQPD